MTDSKERTQQFTADGSTVLQELPPKTDEPLPAFAHFNFKLAVVEILMYKVVNACNVPFAMDKEG